MSKAEPTTTEHDVVEDDQMVTPEHIANLIINADENELSYRHSYDGYLAREIGDALKSNGWTNTSPDNDFTSKIRDTWLISPSGRTKVCLAEASFLGAFTDVSTSKVRHD